MYTKYKETNKKIKIIEIVLMIALFMVSLFSFIYGFIELRYSGDIKYFNTIELYRDKENEDFDENNKVCDVIYSFKDRNLIVSYSYEDYIKLDSDSITSYLYQCDDGTILCFDHMNPNKIEVSNTYKQYKANNISLVYDLAIVSLILCLSIFLIYSFSFAFTLYEKIWFISIMVLACIVSILFPEESANGVSGIIIMLLYLLDTFFNILCELLISKQSRYNFLVSILVEIVEILICIVLMYRFATMVTTLFFWLPIDIISFISWTKHKDLKKDELTIVRKLKGYQEFLVILAIILWTIVIGYLISGLTINSDFFNNKNIEKIIIYIDACASAVGIANGLFIFFRLEEQWIAWYLCAILESIINILSGQYVLLVLKLGYFTNTTYGYIKWNKYIKEHNG